MRFLPRTRGGVLWRALLAAVLIVGFSAGATAVAGLLQVKKLAVEIGQHSQAVHGLTLPAPGQPETILLIGSDHRVGEGTAASYQNAQSDTMLLVHIDDNSQTINLMSIPRDLNVLGPDGTPVKLNSIYSTEDGPSGLIKVLKQQVFPDLQVNHAIDTSFVGFSNLIDAIGCVYTDVDERYYNVTGPGVDNFSSIDIQPGYQRLCGGVHSAAGKNSALAFVRFRHFDNDEVRNARQQDFIRWAKDGYSTTELFNNRSNLIKIFSQNTQLDKSLASTDGLLNLFNLILDANKLSLKTIQFPEYFGACDPSGSTPCYVYPCPELATCSGYGGPNPSIGQPTAATEAVWNEFVTPTAAPAVPTPAAPATPTTPRLARNPAAPPTKLNLAGLTPDPGDGASQAAQLGDDGLPILYPKYVDKGAYGGGYCFSLETVANCDPTALEPESAYVNAYPRRYRIIAQDGRPYDSYVMTLVLNQTLGQYYNVQGTTWTDPPILNHPTKVVHVAGKELWLYEDGGKIADVALKEPGAVYWVSNTLDNVIPNSEMVGMGATLTRYVAKP